MQENQPSLPSGVTIAENGYFEQPTPNGSRERGWIWVNASPLPDAAPSDLRISINLPGYGKVVAFLKYDERFGKYSGGIKQGAPSANAPDPTHRGEGLRPSTKGIDKPSAAARGITPRSDIPFAP